MIAALIGNDIADSNHAKRNQKTERRFRAVRRRAQRIETKNRDALRKSNLLRAFFAGLEGFADKQVK